MLRFLAAMRTILGVEQLLVFFHVFLMKLAGDVKGLVGEYSEVSLDLDKAVAALLPESYFHFLSFFYCFRYVISLPWLHPHPYFSQPYLSTFLSDMLSPCVMVDL